MFERNYLSRMLRYSTQDAFWNRPADHDSAKAASRIGRLRDPNRPKKLTEAQSRQVRQIETIQEAAATRDSLRVEILSKFGALKMAREESIYEDYQALGRMLSSSIRAEERALLKQIQEEYDVTAPVDEIQRQMRGQSSDRKEATPEPETITIKFAERRRIAEAALSNPSKFIGQDGFRRHAKCCLNMIALCKRRERRCPRRNDPEGPLTVRVTNIPVILPQLESEKKHNTSLKCEGFQCLFCLTSNLPWEDKQQVYKSKFSLQRHTDRCRLDQFRSDENIPCPDRLGCGGVVLEGKSHFKNHAARVHNFIL
jgi:hypothetical protein